MDIFKIAHVCHEANRAYCQTLGDMSQPVWDEAPDWQKTSALEGVRLLQADPNAGPETTHKNWLRHKRADGWVPGPVKNPTTKEHPCMVEFDELPSEQQKKDHLFHAIVRALS